MERKLIVISAPSGAGKTSIVKHLLRAIPELRFSVSATTRKRRAGEIDGKDYYFLSVEQFKADREQDLLLEWQEVYDNQFYGTLKSEVDRICNGGSPVIFDVDVLGGINIKKYYGDEALSIFVMPPGLEELADRLAGRGTETAESLRKRLEKAAYEMSFATQFDTVILNDDLKIAQEETERKIRDFLQR